jgi:D-alanine-D-alanine ligase
MDDDRRTRLVLLYGGRSAEHDVSRVTARHVAAAADPERYVVEAVAIDRDGTWRRPELPGEAADALPTTGDRLDPLPALAADPGEQLVVFPLVHGPQGEDGTIQGLLELADVPYVGCGVLSSAVCMDKAMTKQVLAAAGMPQARWVTLSAHEVDDGTADEIVDELGLPVFVKPANMGSSVGVSRADDLASLTAGIDLALTYDEVIVVEEAIDGRELEVGVLGSPGSPAASVVGEVVPAATFYDYADKYHDGNAELHIPADLPPEVADAARGMAIACFEALRCDGMARVDCFWEDPGRGLILNEVNTIPGFTPISMYPSLWEAAGVAYPELIDRLAALAVERHARRRRRTDVDTPHSP